VWRLLHSRVVVRVLARLSVVGAHLGKRNTLSLFGDRETIGEKERDKMREKNRNPCKGDVRRPPLVTGQEGPKTSSPSIEVTRRGASGGGEGERNRTRERGWEKVFQLGQQGLEGGSDMEVAKIGGNCTILKKTEKSL